MYTKLSSKDREWISRNYPTLEIWEQGRLLKGSLRFCKCYPGHKGIKICLNDTYEVEIKFDENHIPHVWEVGGELKGRARNLEINMEDMHVYSSSGKSCLGTPARIEKIIENDPTIEGAFDNLILPYFYYHTYRKTYGCEPWPGLKHNLAVASFQDYYSNGMDLKTFWKHVPWRLLPLQYQKKIILLEKIERSDWDCLCGEAKVKDCHCKAIEGFDKFIEDMRSNSMGNNI